MKGKELFKTLGEKHGFKSEDLAKITGNSALDNIEISDDIANLFKNYTVFTAESARANPEIRATLRAEAYDGIDAHVKTLLGKYELPEDVQAEILKADKTNSRIEKAIEKISDLKEKKAVSSGKAKDVLEKEIEKLNAQILSDRTSHNEAVEKLKVERANDLINYELKSIYGGFDYALPDEMPKNIKIQTAQAIVESKLREQGVKFKMTETGLAPFTSADTEFYLDNKKISSEDLIKKTLLDSKVLKVNNGQQGQPFQQPGNRSFQALNGKDTVIVKNEALQNRLSESMKRDGLVQ